MNEEEIIIRLMGGDKEALGELYEIYISMALRTAYLITSDKFLAEDIAAESFISVYKNIGCLKNPKAFKSWFYRIIVRLSVKLGKKSAKDRPQENIRELSDREAKSAEYFTKEKYEPLYKEIDRLSPKLKTTVVLYYFNDMSVGEIASVMGCFEGTVKSRLHSARNKLKAALKEAEL